MQVSALERGRVDSAPVLGATPLVAMALYSAGRALAPWQHFNVSCVDIPSVCLSVWLLPHPPLL